MTVEKEGEKYKCEICGNEVLVTKAGGGELVCCGEPMVLFSQLSNTDRESTLIIYSGNNRGSCKNIVIVFYRCVATEALLHER